MCCNASAIAAVPLALSLAGGFVAQHTHDGVAAETQVVSPTVLATWAHTGNRLIGMVLWRGKEGWFRAGESRRASYGGGGGAVFGELLYGGINLRFDIKNDRMSVGLDGVVVGDPHSANVVMVDNVDQGRDRWTFEAMSLPVELGPTNIRLQSVLRMSPTLLAFLQCEIRSPDQRKQAAYDRLCAEVLAQR